MTLSLNRILSSLEKSYPEAYAESWDNVGLLIGSPDQSISKVVVALDPVSKAFQFCAEQQAQLLITHHPLFLQNIKKLISPDIHNILSIAYQSQISLACLHTNVDKSPTGLNWYIANKLGMDSLAFIKSSHTIPEIWYGIVSVSDTTFPDFKEYCARILPEDVDSQALDERELSRHNVRLSPERTFLKYSGSRSLLMNFLNNISHYSDSLRFHCLDSLYHDLPRSYGIGLVGELSHPVPFEDFMTRVRSIFSETGDFRLVTPSRSPSPIQKIGVCSGSGGKLLSSLPGDTDLYITGDLNYHQALEAKEREIMVLDAGHYGTEILFLPLMASVLKKEFPSLEVIFYKGENPWIRN